MFCGILKTDFQARIFADIGKNSNARNPFLISELATTATYLLHRLDHLTNASRQIL
jgi:hypothetical protein